MPDIEKLLRKELRHSKCIDTAKLITLIDDGLVYSKVARILFEKVFRGRPNVELVPPSTRRRVNVVAATSLEQELTRGLRSFLEDSGAGKSRGAQRVHPFVMTTIPEDVIFAFAKSQKIPLGKSSLDDVRALLERLQARQPQTKAALRKSFSHLASPAKKAR